MSPTTGGSRGTSRVARQWGVVAALILGGWGTAPAEGLETDRPDFTESPTTIHPRHVQLETGVTATWPERSGGTTRYTGPEALFRLGVASGVELRFGVPDYHDPRTEGVGSGWGDAAVGMKLALGTWGGAWDVGAIGMLSIPSGASGRSSDTLDPEFILTAGRDLDARWSVGSQLELSLPSAEGARRLRGAATLVAGHALSHSTGAFLELAVGDLGAGVTTGTLHHGYTRALGAAVQLDLHGGVDLWGPESGAFVGVGLGAALPLDGEE